MHVVEVHQCSLTFSRERHPPSLDTCPQALRPADPISSHRTDAVNLLKLTTRGQISRHLHSEAPRWHCCADGHSAFHDMHCHLQCRTCITRETCVFHGEVHGKYPLCVLHFILASPSCCMAPGNIKWGLTIPCSWHLADKRDTDSTASSDHGRGRLLQTVQHFENSSTV